MTRERWSAGRRWRAVLAGSAVLVACATGGATRTVPADPIVSARPSPEGGVASGGVVSGRDASMPTVPGPGVAATTASDGGRGNMQSEPAIGGDWLEYSSVSGPELGLSLHERETHLRVDLGQRVAFLEQHQPSSEAGGEPLGTFRAPLTPELAARLRHELAASELDEVQGGGRGGPGTSLIGLKRRGASGTVEARFNNRNLAALRQLRPLLTVLDDVVDFVADKPFQAVRLALEAAPSAPHVFTVELRNVGTEVVFLPDLGQLARAKGDRRGWFGVRVAPFPPPTPGVTPPPLAWRPVELELPPAKSAWLRFSPGQEIAFRTRPVSSAEPGVRHLVQATFASYAGEAVIEGHIVIRGHALSNTLEWVPPPRAATGTPAASGR